MSWKPTEKQLSVYDELVKKYRKIRKQIVRVHRTIERETSTGRVPSLVVPKRIRKLSAKQIRISGKQMFNIAVKQLKKVVGQGLEGFYRDYKHSYMDLISEYLIKEAPEGGTGWGSYYTDAQKEVADDTTKELMTLYNQLRNTNSYVFGFGMKSGRFPEFKKLYEDTTKTFSFSESYVHQFKMGLHSLRYLPSQEAKRVLETGNFGRARKSFDTAKTSSRKYARVGSKGAKTHKHASTK